MQDIVFCQTVVGEKRLEGKTIIAVQSVFSANPDKAVRSLKNGVHAEMKKKAWKRQHQ